MQTAYENMIAPIWADSDGNWKSEETGSIRVDIGCLEIKDMDCFPRFKCIHFDFPGKKILEIFVLFRWGYDTTIPIHYKILNERLIRKLEEISKSMKSNILGWITLLMLRKLFGPKTMQITKRA